VKAAPDDPDRLYVAQKNGIISIIENGQVLGTPFIDLTSVVQDSGEEGLLGLAFHPDYKNNGRFFVHYSKAGNGDNVVMEYKRSAADPHVADPTPVQLVVESTTLEGNHNGGALEFGSDGFLYFSMGDGGQQHDCNCDAQRDTIQGYGPPTDGSLDLLGKISRVDVNGTPDANGYPAAAGNPNGGKAYHRGLRNPWRISFDACTGDLYIGDVGQDTWEEVDVAPVNGGALNFGWPFWEGANDPNDASHHHYATNQCPGNPANAPDCGNEPAATSFTFPIADYHHGAECSITGGYVYRSSAIPALRGTYFYGDYCSGKIWTTSWANGTATTPVLSMITPGNNVLVAFGQDGRGNVYVVDISGTIYRVDAM
jgi:glucose/arabinose dehydrogenase